MDCEKCLCGLDSLGVYFPLEVSGFLPTNTHKKAKVGSRCWLEAVSVSSRGSAFHAAVGLLATLLSILNPR